MGRAGLDGQLPFSAVSFLDTISSGMYPTLCQGWLRDLFTCREASPFLSSFKLHSFSTEVLHHILGSGKGPNFQFTQCQAI